MDHVNNGNEHIVCLNGIGEWGGNDFLLFEIGKFSNLY